MFLPSEIEHWTYLKELNPHIMHYLKLYIWLYVLLKDHMNDLKKIHIKM